MSIINTLKYALLTIICVVPSIGWSQYNTSDTYWHILPWIPTDAPQVYTGIAKISLNKDGYFVVAIVLLTFFALFKLMFPKYANDLLTLLLKTTVKSSHIRDHLQGNRLPSLLLNVYFVMVTGVFISLILAYNTPSTTYIQWWYTVIICALLVAAVYMVKYITLKVIGWVTGMQALVTSYSFAVFYFNKIIGVVLLPIVIFLLIYTGNKQLFIVLGTAMYIVLILYRFIISYVAVQKVTQINQFHFILYLCSMELIPVLLLAKGITMHYSNI